MLCPTYGMITFQEWLNVRTLVLQEAGLISGATSARDLMKKLEVQEGSPEAALEKAEIILKKGGSNMFSTELFYLTQAIKLLEKKISSNLRKTG